MPCSTSSTGTGWGLFSRIARANAVNSACSVSKLENSTISSGGAGICPVGAPVAAGAREYAELIGKHLGKISIVRDRGHQSLVGRERHGRQRLSLLDDGVEELDRHVLGIGGASAIAHHIEPAPALKARGHLPSKRFNSIGLSPEELLFDFRALASLAQDGLFHGATSSRWRPYA